jgi:hypothetical protein
MSLKNEGKTYNKCINIEDYPQNIDECKEKIDK